MSESFERQVIHKRIASLEAQVSAEHRYMDSLYERYSFRVDITQIQDCVESIHQMYEEILILKRIITDADYAAELAAGS